jgi:hypothetical protein
MTSWQKFAGNGLICIAIVGATLIVAGDGAALLVSLGLIAFLGLSLL